MAVTLPKARHEAALCTDCFQSFVSGIILATRNAKGERMEEARRNSLLEELCTILLWEYLWFDASDQDGRKARQLRLEEIARELN